MRNMCFDSHAEEVLLSMLIAEARQTTTLRQVCYKRRGALIMPGALVAADDWLFGISTTLPDSCPTSAPDAPEVLQPFMFL